SISEIAAFLAFSSPSHFDRIFRAETGFTPKEFQARYFRRHQRWRGEP
ncbi:MAG: AraC family transcriptional regulator, partial [Clostridia bacterium]|nr:AraC family transcriptional regulator [Clostridia bacterium]